MDPSHEYVRLSRTGPCACGSTHGDDEECLAENTAANADDALAGAMAQGMLHGLFPERGLRRAFVKTLGRAGALAALTALTPLTQLAAVAQERSSKGVPEKKRLAVGFLPITCATPLIYAEQLGLFPREGLELSLQKVAGIALIRDKMVNGELDISQQVMPVALAMSAGIGGAPIPTRVMTVLNQNGNSLVLAMKHKDNRDPKNWKGFRFAVPFEQSHQMLQLRHYLASAGLDADRDVSYRVVPPSEYVSNLRVGNIDGFFGGEPGGQRAVYEGAGFIHLVSSEIWPEHPCCSVTATETWIKAHPNSFMAAYRAIIAASLHVSEPANRAGMAKILAQPQYLNQPETVVDQVLTGRYADGLGNVKTLPRRIDFQPFPHYSSAVWLLTQMRRWNMIKEDLDYKGLARQVMLATDAKRLIEERGGRAPEVGFRKETILGKSFDSDRPADYLKSLGKA
ncbi:CmpA/NrtA family ABC transporter substrate-binding protein [Variovorax sp. AFSI2.2]|uniref:CmpA/NrtA family ABC transporter substrate-binding protein n=1 Tax=Variovorax sp. AFSI2.2 TaxID=3384160 RepID=UPI003EB9A3E3